MRELTQLSKTRAHEKNSKVNRILLLTTAATMQLIGIKRIDLFLYN